MTPGAFQTPDYTTKIITFAPTLVADLGPHTVTVTASDGMDTITATFTVTVNQPPAKFTNDLASQTLKLGASINYPLPSVFNPVTGDATGITVSYTTTQSFVSFNSLPFPGSIDINPVNEDFTIVGPSTIGITLTASQGSQEYTLTITVTNSAPYFLPPPPSVIKVAYNSFYVLDLATFSTDDELNSLSLTSYFTAPGGIKTTITTGLFKQ